MEEAGASGLELDLQLPEDAHAAAERYIELRRCVREIFQGFLRSIDAHSLHSLESHFSRHGGSLDRSDFQSVLAEAFPQPQEPAFALPREQQLIVRLAVATLFVGIDVYETGRASWIKFVEFVCAVAEAVRLKSKDGERQMFDFRPAPVPNCRPAMIGSCFDKVFFWPGHPADAAIVFEEGQASFHLHAPRTLTRRRTVGGHRADLLAATFMPAPIEWVVTSANDGMLCFWDSSFNLVKKWKMDRIAGALCWCPGPDLLYYSDFTTQRLSAWRIRDTLEVRMSSEALKQERGCEIVSGHTKGVQAMVWLGSALALATASLDMTVRLFDVVEGRLSHVLTGHTKAITSLVYCQKAQLLISCGFDTFMLLWNTAGTLCHKLPAHDNSIVSICAVPGSDFEFASVDCLGVVKLWDMNRLLCTQSFHAVDARSEKAGELDCLNPRALCMLSRERLLISGRKLVVFERDASDPQLTSDFNIQMMAFVESRTEIVTPVKNNLYLWCALSGSLLSVHSKVCDSNISAMQIGRCERRIFVGGYAGELNAVNLSCGLLLRKLTAHSTEVTQIECLPGKVMTHSAADRLLLIHDDRDTKKPIVLKRLYLGDAAPVAQISCGDREVVACGSEDGSVVWYNIEFAKPVGSSARCEDGHGPAGVTCCHYLRKSPLVLTADHEGFLIFWSTPPLLPYSFYAKAMLPPGSDGISPRHPSADSEGSAASAGGVGAVAMSWPDEDCVFVGTERGTIMQLCIRPVVRRARAERDEIVSLTRAGSHQLVASVTGRSISAGCEVISPSLKWTVPRAHRSGVEQLVVCKRRPASLLSLGADMRVRVWNPEPGEALGTLRQGLPDGDFAPESVWRFPADAHQLVQRDCELVASLLQPSGDAAVLDVGSGVAGGKQTGADAGHRGASAGKLGGHRRRIPNDRRNLERPRVLAESVSMPDFTVATWLQEGGSRRGLPRQGRPPSGGGGSRASSAAANSRAGSAHGSRAGSIREEDSAFGQRPGTSGSSRRSGGQQRNASTLFAARGAPRSNSPWLTGVDLSDKLPSLTAAVRASVRPPFAGR